MLTNLTGNFTQYKLESVMKLTKKGAIRLFEILMQRADGNNEFDDGMAHRFILKKDLHVAFGLSPSAIKNNHLEMRHLIPYKAEINENLHMNLNAIENADSWHFTYKTRDKIETEQSVESAEKVKNVKKVIPQYRKEEYLAKAIYENAMAGADVAKITLKALKAVDFEKKRIADNLSGSSKKEQS